MSFKIGKIEVPDSIYNNYINELINKTFKILPIYEDCFYNEAETKLENYYTYLDKIILTLQGSEILFEKKDFLSLVSILTGLREKTDTNKKEVKSVVFHSIDLLDKMKR